MTSQPGNREKHSQSKWTWIVPLVMLVLLVGLYFVWSGFQTFIDEAYDVLSSGEQAQIQAWVDGFGGWGFAIIIALMLLQTLIPFLPSLAIMVVAVLAYGPVFGGLLAWGGLLLAASLGYGIGRAFGPVTVDRLIGTKAEQKVEEIVERYGVWAIIAARISPILSTDAISIVAGLVKMSFWRFLLATAAGILPLTILIAWLGSDISRLQTGLLWISVISVVVFAGYVVYDRRKRP